MSSPRDRVVDVALVLSDGERSWPDRLETMADEHIAVGFEFEHTGSRFIVTGVETMNGFAAEARAADIRVVQAKRFDTVVVKFAVNEGSVTKSYAVRMDPDAEVHIGQVVDAQGRLLVAKTMKSDQNRTLHKGFLLARNVRRIFCDPAPPGAQEGEIIATRRRGKPPGGQSKPRRGPKR